MATNKSLFTNGGKKVMLNRYIKTTPDYTVPTKIKLGINTTTSIDASDTDLQQAVPIQNGTINDNGEQTFTGSSGGDNSTDNTTTYKDGAGETDNTGQNLIANGTNATKIWTIANLATAGTLIDSSQYCGLWLYIKDATTLAKIVSAQIKLGSDTSNYYYKTYLVADLSTGWNWLYLGLPSALTETGTVSGNIDTFIITIVTNNATDTFVAGDVVYDLLRQWEESDLYQTFDTGYPTLDEINNEVTYVITINANQAAGFPLDSCAVFNADTTEIMVGESSYDEDGKSVDDEFKYIIKERFN